jgi:8-oxo-dGTP diphosphatase
MITVAGGIIEKDGKVLIAQRHRDDSHGLKWEFPGGTLKHGERGEDGVVREIMEELNLVVEVVRYFGSYTEPPIRVLYYLLRYISGDIKLVEHEEAKWVSKEQLLDYDLLPGDIVIAQKLIHQSKLAR